MPARLFGLAISANETMTNYMLLHRLGHGRYVRMDDPVDGTLERAVELDRTDAKARLILSGHAEKRARHMLNDSRIQTLLSFSALTPTFYYGEHAKKGEPAYA